MEAVARARHAHGPTSHFYAAILGGACPVYPLVRAGRAGAYFPTTDGTVHANLASTPISLVAPIELGCFCRAFMVPQLTTSRCRMFGWR